MDNPTIEEYIKNLLINCGMFPDQATAVIDMMKADPANESLNGRWNDLTSDYPDVILKLAWMSAKDHALAWISVNCPQAWYKPMFESDKVTE